MSNLDFKPYSEKHPDSPCEKAGSIQFLIDCPNMKDVDGDLDMEAERYECKVCGAKDKLYYSEMT